MLMLGLLTDFQVLYSQNDYKKSILEHFAGHLNPVHILIPISVDLIYLRNNMKKDDS